MMRLRTHVLPSVLLIAWCLYCQASAFVLFPPQPQTTCSLPSSSQTTAARCSCSTFMMVAVGGDPLRAATGIRPSLHPTTINAIAEALRLRAMGDPDTPLVVGNGIQPLQVALSAGKIAATAIQKRQVASSTTDDGMMLTPSEQQTIAGRVVGVILRLESLEPELHSRVLEVDSWVHKYGEFEIFGVLPPENHNSGGGTTCSIPEKIKTDPLFSLCRAECLLALFLDTVEAPQMAKIGQSVPGGSFVDFLDEDRKQVLLLTN